MSVILICIIIITLIALICVIFGVKKDVSEMKLEGGANNISRSKIKQMEKNNIPEILIASFQKLLGKQLLTQQIKPSIATDFERVKHYNYDEEELTFNNEYYWKKLDYTINVLKCNIIENQPNSHKFLLTCKLSTNNRVKYSVFIQFSTTELMNYYDPIIVNIQNISNNDYAKIALWGEKNNGKFKITKIKFVKQMKNEIKIE